MIKISDFFYTETEAAEILCVNRITIWRWIKQGRFNVQRFGSVVFIPKDEVKLIKKERSKCTTSNS
jgi:excisionase family DNA binding protein